jgi:replicative DNA helicase
MKSSQPFAEDYERKVLGCMAVDSDAYRDGVDMLVDDDFFTPLRKRLFNLLVSCGSPPRSLFPGRIKLHFGNEYSAALDEWAMCSQNALRTYDVSPLCAALRGQSRLRRLNDTCLRIASELSSGKGIDNPDEFTKQAELELAEVMSGRVEADTDVTFHQAALDALDRLQDIQKNPESHRGRRMDIASIDALTGGLKPGTMNVIAGRPSMGKSVLAWQHALACASSGHVLIASIEMGEHSLCVRSMASFADIDSEALDAAELTEREWNRAVFAADKLSKINGSFTKARTCEQLRRSARLSKKRHGKLGVVLVDYLQLLGLEKRSQSREVEVSSMSRSLKLMAEECECPVIVVSQLSRKVEERTVKRPMMSDLRESGAIEQDADSIIFIYRDDYYNKPAQDTGVSECEVTVAKNRNGKTGTALALFERSFSRFKAMP